MQTCGWMGVCQGRTPVNATKPSRRVEAEFQTDGRHPREPDRADRHTDTAPTDAKSAPAHSRTTIRQRSPNSGGATCPAAIVARELSVPCAVGAPPTCGTTNHGITSISVNPDAVPGARDYRLRRTTSAAARRQAQRCRTAQPQAAVTIRRTERAEPTTSELGAWLIGLRSDRRRHAPPMWLPWPTPVQVSTAARVADRAADAAMRP